MEHIIKNAALGAFAGAAYGALQMSLHRGRKYSFSSSHPDLGSDQQLSNVLNRFSRLSVVDQEMYDSILKDADSLIRISRNPSVQGGQFKVNRLANDIKRKCKSMCLNGSRANDSSLSRDAAALEMELEYIDRLCSNYIHNMII